MNKTAKQYGITPGPWSVEDQREYKACNSKVTCCAGYVVARTYHTPNPRITYEAAWNECEANARAIAEVPNMIEALRKAHGYLRVLPGADDAVLEINALLARIASA